MPIARRRHRDLKPANIMMNERGEPVVMDFGLARLAGECGAASPDRALLGTPAYHVAGAGQRRCASHSPPCDIYSLGVILYELLTGHLGFEGSVGAVLGSNLDAGAKQPSASRPDLDPRLEAICLKGCRRRCGAVRRA